MSSADGRRDEKSRALIHGIFHGIIAHTVDLGLTTAGMSKIDRSTRATVREPP